MARVAMARGDAASALVLLDRLEFELPLVAEEVEQRRAEAKAAVGPFDQAGEWYAKHLTATYQLEAARAFDRAGDAERARNAADHVVSSVKRTRAQEGEARALRARLSTSGTDLERVDARWLAVFGADLPAATNALALLEALDPLHPLMAAELLSRSRVLSRAGLVDDALASLTRVEAASGAESTPRLLWLRARARTLYEAHGRDLEASRVFAECAALGGPGAPEDAFYAARALSRADRDEAAVEGYLAVMRRYPGSPWARQAEFYVPYLRMLHAEWNSCAKGFAAFLEGHARSSQSWDAERYGAICSLLEGDAPAARRSFTHLATATSDPASSARMVSLEAVASYRIGDIDGAAARWTSLVHAHPLSWAGLISRARLLASGRPSPTIPRTMNAIAVDAEDDLPPLAKFYHSLGFDAEAERSLRPFEPATLSKEAPSNGAYACSLYSTLGRSRRRFQLAQHLSEMALGAVPSEKTEWAWSCAYPVPYADSVREAESTEGLPCGLLWAVMRQESGFDPDAVSPAHAVGLMQLLPETAQSVAEELGLPTDASKLHLPRQSIHIGARVLKHLLGQFHQSIPLAVAAYNGGAASVVRWLTRAQGMELDTFIERIPYEETREYTFRVMTTYARYRYLVCGGDGGEALSLDLPTL